MHRESSGSAALGGGRLQRAIVLQLLREDRAPRWSGEELGAELGAERAAVEEAIRGLGGDGVLCAAGGEVWASRAVQRLDELGLIAL
ncbi:MAG TPA: hypothetical protein VKG38_15590 [Solirubrobacteraceae bacterium]|nr:hypothetical protein [Solirubrobacteraceae bacterium]